jgi:hypothetical protein
MPGKVTIRVEGAKQIEAALTRLAAGRIARSERHAGRQAGPGARAGRHGCAPVDWLFWHNSRALLKNRLGFAPDPKR